MAKDVAALHREIMEDGAKDAEHHTPAMTQSTRTLIAAACALLIALFGVAIYVS